MTKNPPAMQETQVCCWGQEDPLEKVMTTHSSILAWKIPWKKKEPGRLHPWSRKESDMTKQLSLSLSPKTKSLFHRGSSENSDDFRIGNQNSPLWYQKLTEQRYWVCQNVCVGFPITSYGKIQMNFCSTQNIKVEKICISAVNREGRYPHFGILKWYPLN